MSIGGIPATAGEQEAKAGTACSRSLTEGATDLQVGLRVGGACVKPHEHQGTAEQALGFQVESVPQGTGKIMGPAPSSQEAS